MFVESIQAYPVTGARGVTPAQPMMGYDGIDNSRRYVAYDPETFMRISTKPGQAPGLHRIQPLMDTGLELEFCDEAGEPTGHEEYMPLEDGRDIFIDEFGDLTPVVDLGDKIAGTFTEFLGKSVRIARKKLEIFKIAPKDRANAPLHIVTSESLRWVAQRTGLSEFEVMRRFRPDIVVNNDGAEPFEELQWAAFNLASERVITHRPAFRCPVPSQDPFSGKNLKDVAKVYQDLPQRVDSNGRSRPVFGMYGYLDCVPYKKISIFLGQTLGTVERVEL